MQSFHSCFILSLSLSRMQDGGSSDGFANHPSAFFYSPLLFLFYSAFLYMDLGNCRQGEDFSPPSPRILFCQIMSYHFSEHKGEAAPSRGSRKKSGWESANFSLRQYSKGNR